MQSQRALQNEIFKLDYEITDAAEQVNYWSQRWFPWQIDVRAGQDTQFMIGGALTIVALLLAGFSNPRQCAGLGGGLRVGRNRRRRLDVANVHVDYADRAFGGNLDGNHALARVAAAEICRGTGSTGGHHAGERGECGQSFSGFIQWLRVENMTNEPGQPDLTTRKLVRDLMTVGVPTCPPTTPLVDLTRLMLEKNWEAVVVLDGEKAMPSALSVRMRSSRRMNAPTSGRSRRNRSCTKVCRRFRPMFY